VVLSAGSTFLFDLRGNIHLWVVASDPDDEGRFLVVSLTSLKGSRDQTVILHGGEHPFLKWPTCVFYQQSDIMTVAQLEQLIASGNAKMRETMAADKTALILDGFLASEFTRKRVIAFARAYKAKRQGWT
jgi:hypothetical protein